MTRMLVLVVIWTLVLEAVTVGCRFGGGLQSTRDTAPYLCALTHGLRIHHGYFGVVMAVTAPWLAPRRRRWAERFTILGLALVASDLIHHLLVLWPLTGSPQFDLVYPAWHGAS